tara:strand:- start:82 stop:213 length:132 start_codon:yes stop_codon:yes gene_type:complete
MIDKFIYKFFAGLDRMLEAMATAMAGKRCKCGNKKKHSCSEKK